MDRWDGIERPYTEEDVRRLRGSVHVEHSLARLGAERLWRLLHEEEYVAALGALTGGQAVQMVKAGLKAIYLSRLAGRRGCEPCRSDLPGPEPLPGEQRAGARAAAEQRPSARRSDRVGGGTRATAATGWRPSSPTPRPASEAPLNSFELMKAMIEAGAAGVHFEDQLASEKKCGHLGGKVLVPTSQFVRTLAAARLAADVCDVPTLLVARTDALSANLLTSDADERDHRFLTGERTPEGYFRVEGGLESAIARGLAYAPYADLLWCETSTPDLEEARDFAAAIHEQFPGKLLAYNCSPSFNWRRHLDDDEIAGFQRELGGHGLQVPVHHAGGLPRAQRSDVRARRRLRRRGHDRLRPAPGAGVRPRRGGLHGDAPPARGRRRLLRPRRPGGLAAARARRLRSAAPPKKRSSSRPNASPRAGVEPAAGAEVGELRL